MHDNRERRTVSTIAVCLSNYHNCTKRVKDLFLSEKISPKLQQMMILWVILWDWKLFVSKLLLLPQQDPYFPQFPYKTFQVASSMFKQFFKLVFHPLRYCVDRKVQKSSERESKVWMKTTKCRFIFKYIKYMHQRIFPQIWLYFSHYNIGRSLSLPTLMW
jgi:hypothetical protein